MSISPKDHALMADRIRLIYEDAELQLFKQMARALVRDPEIPDWQNVKLAQLSELLKDSRRVTGALDKRIPAELNKMIELAYMAGNDSAAADLKAALETIMETDAEMPKEMQMVLFPQGFPETKTALDATMATFGGINKEAVEALAGSITNTMAGRHLQIVRQVEDIFRDVITEVVGSTLVGTETRLEVAQRALDKFADGGIKVFRDSRGYKWDVATYAESATRSAIGQASVEGHLNQMSQYGFDLIQVSDHMGECELCRPWEGKVLSRSGNSTDHDSLDKAIGAGLFHTNCGHRLNTYFEGLTEPLTNTEDPEGYKDRQEQRYLERGIRKWKARQAVAMTPEAVEKSNDKVAEWTERIDVFTTEKGRRRKREREQNKRAR